MINGELGEKFAKTLRDGGGTSEFAEIVGMALDEHERSEPFRTHVANRLKQIDEATGGSLAAGEFGTTAARALVADETGFAGWTDLIDTIEQRREDPYP